MSSNPIQTIYAYKYGSTDNLACVHVLDDYSRIVAQSFQPFERANRQDGQDNEWNEDEYREYILARVHSMMQMMQHERLFVVFDPYSIDSTEVLVRKADK